MKERYFKVIVILLFAFLAAVEIGIFLEVLWHGWGGFGDISMEYTEKGTLGSACLIGFIPVSVLVLFMMYIVMYLKKKRDKKQFFLNCIWPVLGIAIATGGLFLVPQAPFYKLGRWIAAFFIDYFNWMKYPVP